jgi:hypothetical protein
METEVTIEEALNLVEQLSLMDRARLIERLALSITRELTVAQPTLRKSLRGLWRGLDITDEDIAEARCEMWGNFPREDI